MAAVELDDEEFAIRQRLKDDFPHYASRCLKIRPKAGGLVPVGVSARSFQSPNPSSSSFRAGS